MAHTCYALIFLAFALTMKVGRTRIFFYLDEFVPAARHDDGVGGVGREAHARHPLGVAVLLDRVLAHSERVPQLYGLVTRTRHDLTVVGGESYAQHVLGVSHKLTGGCSSVIKINVPTTLHAMQFRHL